MYWYSFSRKCPPSSKEILYDYIKQKRVLKYGYYPNISRNKPDNPKLYDIWDGSHFNVMYYQSKNGADRLDKYDLVDFPGKLNLTLPF